MCYQVYDDFKRRHLPDPAMDTDRPVVHRMLAAHNPVAGSLAVMGSHRCHLDLGSKTSWDDRSRFL